jgi:hypothetical protein
MQRVIVVAMAVLATLALAMSAAWAGNPHFVSCSAERTDDSVVVSGKEAGLGDEAEVDIEITATALCINGGGKHPKAVNKQSLSDEFPVTVQNGKADYIDTLTATFDPPCEPPMTVQFRDIKVTDNTNNISCTIVGTF